MNSYKGIGFTDSYIAYPNEAVGVFGAVNFYRLPAAAEEGKINFVTLGSFS